MKTEITGQIKEIGQIEQVKETFKKRNLVIETGGDYPQIYGCELVQDKCALADVLQVGQTITAKCDIRGREWTNPGGIKKYFVTINIWAVDPPAVDTSNTPPVDLEDAVKDLENQQEDGLPF